MLITGKANALSKLTMLLSNGIIEPHEVFKMYLQFYIA